LLKVFPKVGQDAWRTENRQIFREFGAGGFNLTLAGAQ
jgi:hypothetical protein